MTAIPGASALSMSSLYALMGQAMPAGASTDGAASNPALAMEAAANASAGMDVLTLLGSLGAGGAASTAPASAAAALSKALASLSYLDPANELALLGGSSRS